MGSHPVSAAATRQPEAEAVFARSQAFSSNWRNHLMPSAQPATSPLGGPTPSTCYTVAPPTGTATTPQFADFLRGQRTPVSDFGAIGSVALVSSVQPYQLAHAATGTEPTTMPVGNATLAGRARQHMPTTFVQHPTPLDSRPAAAARVTPHPGAAVVSHPAARKPMPLIIPEKVPDYVPYSKIMNGEITGVPFFSNITPEAGITLVVHGRKYLHDYCLCDTACNLVVVSKDVASEMGLTPSANNVQLFQVAGTATAGVYSQETVSAIWMDGSQHAVTLHTEVKYLILEHVSPVFKVLVGSPLLDRVCGRPCAALGEFGLHPYYGQGQLKPAFTIPLCRMPPRPLPPALIASAGVQPASVMWQPSSTSGRDWLAADVGEYGFAAVVSDYTTRPYTRKEVQTMLMCGNIEINPGP